MQELSNEIASKYEEIIEKIKFFSNQFLNDEYKNICVLAAETLFLNCEEQFKKGKSSSWAAGIVHAIGAINNLFDSKEVPYVKASDLYKTFEISSSTGSNKSKEVKRLLDLSEENKQWIIGNSKSAEVSKNAVVEAQEEVAVTMDNLAEKEEQKEALRFAVDRKYVEAQRIVNYAWKQKNYNNRAKYAKEALDIYEDCADAYIILSKNSSLNVNEKKVLLEKAVRAAQNLLKIDNLENAQIELLSTGIAEPLFGAKYSLAVHLWENKEREAAIENLLEILKYDKQDKLRVRSLVVNWLLIEKKYTELKSLLEKYEKDNLAAIYYSKVVLLYKTNEIKEAEIALRRAYKRNPYVIPYISRQKRVPNSLPQVIRLGSEEEAMKYADSAMEVWNNQDMIKWVKEKKKDFDLIRF